MAGRTSDFSTVASRYDATREVPEHVLIACYEMLTDRGVLPSGGTILDAGCGTGQMSIPLTTLGLQVVGIDISEEMARIASTKVESGRRAQYEAGDVRSIGYPDRTFEGVVFSKLLMHIEDWRQCCEELIRVVRPGAPIVHLIDRGTYADSVRREFSRRIDDLGFKSRFLGAVSSSGEISAYMSRLGCEVKSFRDARLTWDRHITRRQSLDAFSERLFAEFWYLPAGVYDEVLTKTRAWAEAQRGGLDEPERLSGYLVVDTYTTPASESPMRG